MKANRNTRNKARRFAVKNVDLSAQTADDDLRTREANHLSKQKIKENRKLTLLGITDIEIKRIAANLTRYAMVKRWYKSIV